MVTPPKVVEKAKPFFKLLKLPKDFQWSEKCGKMFSEFKTFLATLTVLTRLTPKVKLLLYLSVSDSTISLTLL